MLKIKLSRLGKKARPFYRIIIAEAKSRRDGKYIDLLGAYNPMEHPAGVVLDKEKYAAWINKGAQPTDTVRQLFKKIAK